MHGEGPDRLGDFVFGYYRAELTPEEETRHTVEALTSSVTACLDIFVQN